MFNKNNHLKNKPNKHRRKAESYNFQFNKKFLYAFLALLIFFAIFLFKYLPVTSHLSSLSAKSNNYDSQDDVINTDVGQNAKISESVITKTATGVAPFDAQSSTDSSNSDGSVTWTAGNDVSADDNIVRSFDQITWTIENTFILKENASTENYKGGTIEITASLPSDLAGVVKWDLDSMLWAENASVSSDGINFTAQYSMSSTEITIPGKQTLVLILSVEGASNGLEIAPTFVLNLLGNDESDKISISSETVYVSAAPRYNVQLIRNDNLSKKTTVNYGIEDTSGRMYGYGLAIQLYNSDKNKGLKGIEYPKGDITFDLDLKLTRTEFNSSTQVDITDECTPVLWNYKINQEGSSNGIIPNRNMQFGNIRSYYLREIPYGNRTNDRTKSTYNSGNISMIQENKTISVKISRLFF